MNRKCIGGKYQYLPSRLFILPADSYSQTPKRLSLNIYTKKQYHIRFFWYPSHMYHSTLDFQDASTLHNLLCYHSAYNVSIFSFLLFWTPRIVFYFVFYFTSVLSNSAGYVPRTLYGTVSMRPWLCAWGTFRYIYIFFRLCTAQWVFARGYVLEALLDIFIFFPALYGIVGMRPWIWGNGQIVGSVCPQRSIRSGKNSRGSALCWDLFFRVHLCAFGPMYSSGCLFWFIKR